MEDKITFSLHKRDELIKKYPSLKSNILELERIYSELNEYFGELVDHKDLFEDQFYTLTIINRNNQCIIAATYCLYNDLYFPLVNICRQLIELFATNNYVLQNKQNLKKVIFGKKGHKDQELNIPNILTLIDKLKEIDPLLRTLYDYYSELSHPNPAALFSTWTPDLKEEGTVYINSTHREIPENQAKHIITNLINLSKYNLVTTKEIMLFLKKD